MNFRTLAPLFACLLAAASAHAQVGVYGEASVERLSNIAYTSIYSGSSNSADVNPVGGTVGVQYDFRNFGPIRLGADARGEITRTKRGVLEFADGAGTRIDSGLGGVRISMRNSIFHLRPYGIFDAGVGHLNFGIGEPNFQNLPTTITGFEFRGFIGLDIPVGSFIDFRIPELGTGGIRTDKAIDTVNGVTTTNTTRTYPLNSVSAGVVFHFPR